MSNFNRFLLKHNPSEIKKKIAEKGESFFATETLFLIFPKRFLDKNLAYIENKVKLIGIFIIIDENNNYSLTNIPNFLTMEPNSISSITIDDKEYIKLEFKKDSIILSNVNLVMNDDFVFNIFDDFFISGNIPFYLNYEDLLSFFLSVRKYANSSIADNPKGIEILISIITRSKSDRSKYLRQVLKSKDELKKDIQTYISLSNLTEGYNNSISRLTGSYLKEGMVSVLVDPETKESDINSVLTT